MMSDSVFVFDGRMVFGWKKAKIQLVSALMRPWNANPDASKYIIAGRKVLSDEKQQ
jgi:hypothetical protein